MSAQGQHIIAVVGLLAVAWPVVTAQWRVGSSEFRHDISKNHRDISKNHSDNSKNHRDISKNPRDISKNHSDVSKNLRDISKYHHGFSKNQTDTSKYHQGFSKFHGAVGQSTVLLAKGEGGFKASGQVVAERWWVKAWDRPESAGGPSGARSPPGAVIPLDEAEMRNIL